MTTLLLISNNQMLEEDLTQQISRFDSGFEIFTSPNDEENIDLILLDEETSKVSSLTEQYPQTPIVLLYSEDGACPEGVYKAMKKPFALNELLFTLSSAVNLIENTMEGYIHFSRYELRPSKKELFCKKTGKTIKLTEKEVSILKYLYKAKKRMVSKNELLENVWNYNSEVSTHTLETHIYRLRQKIEKGDKTSHLIITHDGGYQLRP